MIPAPRRTAIRRKLLRWYDLNRRDLPWRRRADDPYAQWVAEVMLQQTRVDTVIDYYERFIARFPTIQALARADYDDVLKHWEGLGYYRRILHLYRGAQQLAEAGDSVPSSVEKLRELPGIGIYTAAAIASIAFGRREAAVDGNVARVIARIFGVREDILSRDGDGAIRGLARELLSPSRPGDFNQAWMDLGSIHCTPKSPTCSQCPMIDHCVAAATGKTGELPIRRSRTKVIDVAYVVGVFLDRGRFLVSRRPPGGLWSRLWELPNAETNGGTVRSTALKRVVSDMGLTREGRSKKISPVSHKLTHRAITFYPYLVRVAPVDKRRKIKGFRWVTLQQFSALSVSTAHRRILAAVEPYL